MLAVLGANCRKSRFLRPKGLSYNLPAAGMLGMTICFATLLVIAD